MSDPDFVAETFDAYDYTHALQWWKGMVDHAKSRGCTWPRFSWDDERRGLLFEAWKERPENEGQQRWSNNR